MVEVVGSDQVSMPFRFWHTVEMVFYTRVSDMAPPINTADTFSIACQLARVSYRALDESRHSLTCL